MSVIIRLQNLPWTASAMDIRRFFYGLQVPDGGVHIVGGDQGDAFIAFSNDEDARRAMLLDGGRIGECIVKLCLSSKTEMQNIIQQAREKSSQKAASKKIASSAFGLSQSTPASSKPTFPESKTQDWPGSSQQYGSTSQTSDYGMSRDSPLQFQHSDGKRPAVSLGALSKTPSDDVSSMSPWQQDKFRENSDTSSRHSGDNTADSWYPPTYSAETSLSSSQQRPFDNISQSNLQKDEFRNDYDKKLPYGRPSGKRFSLPDDPVATRSQASQDSYGARPLANQDYLAKGTLDDKQYKNSRFSLPSDPLVSTTIPVSRDKPSTYSRGMPYEGVGDKFSLDTMAPTTVAPKPSRFDNQSSFPSYDESGPSSKSQWAKDDFNKISAQDNFSTPMPSSYDSTVLNASKNLPFSNESSSSRFLGESGKMYTSEPSSRFGAKAENVLYSERPSFADGGYGDKSGPPFPRDIAKKLPSDMGNQKYPASEKVFQVDSAIRSRFPGDSTNRFDDRLTGGPPKSTFSSSMDGKFSADFKSRFSGDPGKSEGSGDFETNRFQGQGSDGLGSRFPERDIFSGNKLIGEPKSQYPGALGSSSQPEDRGKQRFSDDFKQSRFPSERDSAKGFNKGPPDIDSSMPAFSSGMGAQHGSGLVHGRIDNAPKSYSQTLPQFPARSSSRYDKQNDLKDYPSSSINTFPSQKPYSQTHQKPYPPISITTQDEILKKDPRPSLLGPGPGRSSQDMPIKQMPPITKKAPLDLPDFTRPPPNFLSSPVKSNPPISDAKIPERPFDIPPPGLPVLDLGNKLGTAKPTGAPNTTRPPGLLGPKPDDKFTTRDHGFMDQPLKMSERSDSTRKPALLETPPMPFRSKPQSSFQTNEYESEAKRPRTSFGLDESYDESYDNARDRDFNPLSFPQDHDGRINKMPPGFPKDDSDYIRSKPLVPSSGKPYMSNRGPSFQSKADVAPHMNPNFSKPPPKSHFDDFNAESKPFDDIDRYEPQQKAQRIEGLGMLGTRPPSSFDPQDEYSDSYDRDFRMDASGINDIGPENVGLERDYPHDFEFDHDYPESASVPTGRLPPRDLRPPNQGPFGEDRFDGHFSTQPKPPYSSHIGMKQSIDQPRETSRTGPPFAGRYPPPTKDPIPSLLGDPSGGRDRLQGMRPPGPPGPRLPLQPPSSDPNIRAGPGPRLPLQPPSSDPNIRAAPGPGPNIREPLGPDRNMREPPESNTEMRDSFGPGPKFRETHGPGANMREPLGPGANMREPLGRGANMREPLGPGANMREPLGRGANMREPLGRGANMRDPLGRGANMREPLGPDANMREPIGPGPHIRQPVGPGPTRGGLLDSGPFLREAHGPGMNVSGPATSFEKQRGDNSSRYSDSFEPHGPMPRQGLLGHEPMDFHSKPPSSGKPYEENLHPLRPFDASRFQDKDIRSRSRSPLATQRNLIDNPALTRKGSARPESSEGLYLGISNLTNSISIDQISRFFRDCSDRPNENMIKIIYDSSGKATGKANIKFSTAEDIVIAKQLNGKMLLGQHVAVYNLSKEEYENSVHSEKKVAINDAEPKPVYKSENSINKQSGTSRDAPYDSPLRKARSRSPRDKAYDSPLRKARSRSPRDAPYDSPLRKARSRSPRVVSQRKRSKSPPSDSQRKRSKSPVAYSQRKRSKSPLEDSQKSGWFAELKNIPYSKSSRREVRNFFRNNKIARDGDAIHLEVDRDGKDNGMALIEFYSKHDWNGAQKMHNRRFGSSSVKVYRVTRDEYDTRITKSRDYYKTYKERKERDRRDSYKHSTSEKEDDANLTSEKKNDPKLTPEKQNENGNFKTGESGNEARIKVDTITQISVKETPKIETQRIDERRRSSLKSEVFSPPPIKKEDVKSPEPPKPETLIKPEQQIKREPQVKLEPPMEAGSLKLNESVSDLPKRNGSTTFITQNRAHTAPPKSTDEKLPAVTIKNEPKVDTPKIETSKEPVEKREVKAESELFKSPSEADDADGRKGSGSSWAEQVEEEEAAQAARDAAEKANAVELPTCISMDGIPYNVTPKMIFELLKGIKIEKRIQFINLERNRNAPICFLELASHEECMKAIKRDKRKIGLCVITIKALTKEEMVTKKQEVQAHYNSIAPSPYMQQRPRKLFRLQVSNLPFHAAIEDIMGVFGPYEPNVDKIIFRYGPDGRPTGDAMIPFFDQRKADTAFRDLNRQQVLGRTVFIEKV